MIFFNLSSYHLIDRGKYAYFGGYESVFETAIDTAYLVKELLF
jgi:hypothetical protein